MAISVAFSFNFLFFFTIFEIFIVNFHVYKSKSGGGGWRVGGNLKRILIICLFVCLFVYLFVY